MKRITRYIIGLTVIGYLCVSFAMGRISGITLSPESFTSVQELRDSLRAEAKKVDSIAKADSLKRDSIKTAGALSKTSSDNTSPRNMDSIASIMQMDGKTRRISGDTLLASQDSTKGMNLDAPVNFESADSIVIYPGENFVRMFGKASVKFKQQTLEGDYMHMKTDSGTVYSTYIDYPDSLKKEKIYAKIQDKDQTYEAKSITYNFNSQRGYITDVVTKQGEGYITAGKTKRMENEELFMQGGRYSTCDNHAHPHFYVALTKAKVRPEKNLVSGPIYMVFADVPIPFIFLPFALFPFTQSQSSGVIPPTYGDELDRGFYLRNGGYYFSINDYVDLELTGDIYTKGSWGLRTRSTYNKRYAFRGGIDASYLVTVKGDKVAGDLSKATDFRIAWNHSQDPKANPYRTLSANVNFSTSSYNHNNLNGLYNQAILGENTKSSSVAFTQRFPNSPFSISGSIDITQRSRDSAIAITAPNLSISMSRIFPFKRKKAAGRERWYEKISVSYSGQLRNFIDTKENKILKSNLVKDWRNGFNHSIPVSASFDLFNYFKISPSFNYTERWYTSKIEQAYDPAQGRVVPTDTIYGFNRVYDYNTSLSLSTTVYGFWQPLPFIPFLGKWVSMIRHRIDPSVSLSYRPDFGDPKYGFWRQLSYITPDGQIIDKPYSPYQHQLFGVPGQGKSGSVSISVNNNIEAKIRDPKDSTAFKKISLIDGLSFSTSYNMAADSFHWSDLSASLRLRLSQSFVLSLSGAFDLYTMDYYERDGQIVPYRVDKLRVLNGKGLGRLRSTGASFSYNITPQTFSKLASLFTGRKEEEESEGSNSNHNNSPDGHNFISSGPSEGPSLGSTPGGGGGSLLNAQDHSLGEYDVDGYLKNTMNWSLGFNYSLSLGQDMREFDTRIKEFKYKLVHDLSFNGQFSPTKNWHLNFSANYNFEMKKITNMTCNITRDLHCWSMTASFIPLGPYKSYNFSIAVKSSLLQDLKYRQSNTPRFSTTERWY
ncbi:putative LPS assembly protein LptD [Porphyromonas sp.]|uniref:putative LPS assembly protein LptD n=1 Tax=Porphyromonas sp. TaxID=1924944 RepID=UPI0026DDA4DD|nr:putative LPS assembly protein LptD [Porphyromonas sp.]MDO4770371.1 putative LPS assembly protein LptD [Porphyromonas sp.]